MKRISVVLLALVVIMVCPNLAHARFNVNWGDSKDTPHVKGYNYLATWLVDNSYFNNFSDAKTFAKTGYIGYKSADMDPFYFSMPGLSTTFNVVQEIAGYANSNILGYYQGSGASKTLTQLFSGTENGPKTVNVTGSFGLYLNTPENKFWYTDRKENKFWNPQALVYELVKGKEWLVAWEDLDAGLCGGGDRDYNDMYVKVTATPEPIGAALFVLGAGALGIIKSRRKKNR